MREVAGAAPSGKCLSSRTPHRWHRPCIFRRREIRREGHRGHARVQRGPHPSDDVRGAAQGRRQHGDPRGRRLDRRDARDRPAARAGDLRPQPELRLRRQPEDLLRGSAPRRSRRRRHGPPRLSVRPAARPSDHRADPPRRGRRGAGLTAQDGLGAPAGDAVVEVRLEPLPHGAREPGVPPPALGVPHRIPRLPPRGARARELRPELRRLRLRPGDHRAGRGRALPDRRDRGPDALFSRGVVGELLGVDHVRALHPRPARALRPPPSRAPADPPLRQPPWPLHAPRAAGARRGPRALLTIPRPWTIIGRRSVVPPDAEPVHLRQATCRGGGHPAPATRRRAMAELAATKRLVTTLAILVLVLAAGFYAVAQQMDESKRDRTVPVLGGKYHVLPATLETTQWGWLDPKEPPKLVVNSGDTVAVETMMHAHNKIQPGTTMEENVALRKANPGGGPHSLTGPIYVNGAEPGDVMEIRILKITPKAFGVNFNLPGREFPTIGALASEMPDGFVRYFYLDWDKRQAEFKPGIVVDLQPFPGTLAVGIDPKDPSPRKGGVTDPMAPVSTLRPWKNGSNMDINELQEGTTIYIPIFLKGGLVWTGDSHCRQGNGEVNLTALECAYREIVMQLIVRKDLKLDWPRVETKTHWIMLGFDEDLNRAMVSAVRETVDFLASQKMAPLTRYEAYSLVSMVGDCRVTQVVDVRKGVHCMIPKSIFVKPS